MDETRKQQNQQIIAVVSCLFWIGLSISVALAMIVVHMVISVAGAEETSALVWSNQGSPPGVTGSSVPGQYPVGILVQLGIGPEHAQTPFMARRLGLEPVTYPHPLLKDALEETLGVVIFQEQCLKVARDLAGFTPGQGEQLRRALGSKRGAAEVERFHQEFIAGAQARGVPADVAEMVFDQLRAFGSYSFAKSHAASFAVLVYQLAWLKHYFPVQFTCALLRNQPMGFWQPAVIVMDAKRHGITILAADIERSQGRCTIEGNGIRLGFNYVDGFGEASLTRLVTARQERAFTGLTDLCHPTRLPRRLVERHFPDLELPAGALDAAAIVRACVQAALRSYPDATS